MTTDRAHQLAAIRAWTRNNERARRAYHEDRLIEDGTCGTCKTRRCQPKSRKCSTCAKGGSGKAAERMRARRAKAKENKA